VSDIPPDKMNSISKSLVGIDLSTLVLAMFKLFKAGCIVSTLLGLLWVMR
jgi:hypothetical protein